MRFRAIDLAGLAVSAVLTVAIPAELMDEQAKEAPTAPAKATFELPDLRPLPGEGPEAAWTLPGGPEPAVPAEAMGPPAPERPPVAPFFLSLR